MDTLPVLKEFSIMEREVRVPFWLCTMLSQAGSRRRGLPSLTHQAVTKKEKYEEVSAHERNLQT